VFLFLRILGWLVCAAYSTIPGYWLLIHPRAGYWRAHRSPFLLLLPLWAAMFAIVLLVTVPFRSILIYQSKWAWLPAAFLFGVGLWLYKNGGANFSLKQLGGVPELRAAHSAHPLVTTGIRARVRHPIYLAHLCEMLAWSLGTGLAVCFALTVFAMVTGAWMIRAEDDELEQRFGEAYREYRAQVPAVIPKLTRG